MNVVLADDDKLIVLSLKTILSQQQDITVVAAGNCGKDAVALYFTHKPDILLLDIRMPDMLGTEVAEEILCRDSKAKVLFLTTFADDEYIVKALKMGVKGYILKQDYESLPLALRAVYQGQTVYGDAISGKLPELMQVSAKADRDKQNYPLLEKEYELIRLVADGLSNKEIAAMLFLSEGTVRNYISVILEKLALRDRTQLAIFYYRNLCS